MDSDELEAPAQGEPAPDEQPEGVDDLPERVPDGDAGAGDPNPDPTADDVPARDEPKEDQES